MTIELGGIVDGQPRSETDPDAQGVGAVQPVVIAMLTYRRPDDLAQAIPSILEQTAGVRPAATLMVVDNDPAASARDAVRAFAADGVQYVHEPRPGIAAARNRALTEAPGNALLIFIDDDERPQPGWLQNLVAGFQRSGAAAVVGPVVSEYEQEPEEWIRAGRFFDRRRLPSGTRVDVAATNNLLLDLTQVHALGLTFDEKFGESGGSDTLFTRRLHAAGREMIWCDEAVVTDVVPVGRLTRDWVLRRAFRSGNSWIRTSLELSGTPRGRVLVRVQAVGIGVVRLAGGTARLAAGALTRSMGLRARGLRTMARGGGMLAGAGGYTYREYRRKK